MSLNPELVHLVVATDSPLLFAPTYTHPVPLPPGTLVRVPLGVRQVCGVVLGLSDEARVAEIAPRKLKAIAGVFEALPPLSGLWLELVRFSASYYQRSIGEIVGAALPKMLLETSPDKLDKLLDKLLDPRFEATLAGKRALGGAYTDRHAAMQTLARAFIAGPLRVSEAKALHREAARHVSAWLESGWLRAAQRRDETIEFESGHELSDQQTRALGTIAQAAHDPGPKPLLLWGATGSGKTEVYLQACAELFAREPDAQALVLVPEINLTPQLQAQFATRFSGVQVSSLHSGLADGERLASFLNGHLARSAIVLGTRTAIFASLPRLKLIIVDEEHDASYKAQDGARYCARDLAVWRAHQERIPVVLGSATPSLATWHAVHKGRYRRIDMPERVAASWPEIRLADAKRAARGELLVPAVCEAISARLAAKEQVLVFMNRRGYAPVLRCTQCDWMSDCKHCSAYQVFHKSDRSLRCHHCASMRRVPTACPSCGNLDIRAVGQGTQQLEEWLAERFPQARIARIDADTTRRKHAAEAAFAQVHRGEVDILVGTQMVTKGHDFKRVGLVVAANVDAALYSSDYKASERVFAQLMQAAGRAGRAGLQSEVLIQTAFAKHPLFDALKNHDYASFADAVLQEREAAAMPPYSFHALLRAEARTQEDAVAFLKAAQTQAMDYATQYQVMVYSAVPASLQRLADVERAQLLVEAVSRRTLLEFLERWMAGLRSTKTKVRWALDLDPVEI